MVLVIVLVLTDPVLRRIGLGRWHSSCSGVGSFKIFTMKSIRGMFSVAPFKVVTFDRYICPSHVRVRFSLTWGSKVDGPSAVPAAKEYPMAAVHVLLPSLRVYCSMSTNWCMKSMGPVTSLNMSKV